MTAHKSKPTLTPERLAWFRAYEAADWFDKLTPSQRSRLGRKASS